MTSDRQRDQARSTPGGAALARLWNDLADAVIIADPAGKIVLWNDAAERLFGWPAPEAIGQTLDLIIPERLRDRHWTGYQQVMETGETSYGDRLLEVPAVHRDGRTLSVAFTVTLMTRPDETISHIVAVLRDETARWNERRDLLAKLQPLQHAPGTGSLESSGHEKPIT